MFDTYIRLTYPMANDKEVMQKVREFLGHLNEANLLKEEFILTRGLGLRDDPVT